MDRNVIESPKKVSEIASLSARRAWIEIPGVLGWSPAGQVALRKESVDRNHVAWLRQADIRSRSPQGERG